MVNQVNEKTFDEEVVDTQGKVIVDMYADWCGPCKTMAPMLEDMSERFPDIKFCKLNVDTAPRVISQYKVVSIPTFLFLENGKLVNRVIGGMDEDEFEEEIKKM